MAFQNLEVEVLRHTFNSQIHVRLSYELVSSKLRFDYSLCKYEKHKRQIEPLLEKG
jgi:hypothetical protein